MATGRREFIGASLGLGLLGTRSALGRSPAGQALTARQGRPAAPPVRVRRAKVTKLFKSPEGHPNALAVAPEGLWIAEQKSDNACLVDWNGKLLKKVRTASKNTSGMDYGDGYIWMGANAPPRGVFQTDMNSKTVSHRQVPLGGGGIHGVLWVDGKIWITSTRLRGLLRVDAKTWEPEFMIPYRMRRAHEAAWDNGAIWMVMGDDQGAGLIKYDAATSQALESVRFSPDDPDPHGLVLHEGVLYTCDAGIHPGWPDNKSPASGYICRVEVL